MPDTKKSEPITPRTEEPHKDTPRDRERKEKFDDIYSPDHQAGKHDGKPDHDKSVDPTKTTT